MKRTPGSALSPVLQALALSCLLALPCLLSAALAGDEEGKQAAPYARTPEALRPFGGLRDPYHRYFTEPPAFRGPGRGRGKDTRTSGCAG